MHAITETHSQSHMQHTALTQTHAHNNKKWQKHFKKTLTWKRMQLHIRCAQQEAHNYSMHVYSHKQARAKPHAALVHNHISEKRIR